jgi:hypothetical protein
MNVTPSCFPPTLKYYVTRQCTFLPVCPSLTQSRTSFPVVFVTGSFYRYDTLRSTYLQHTLFHTMAAPNHRSGRILPDEALSSFGAFPIYMHRSPMSLPPSRSGIAESSLSSSLTTKSTTSTTATSTDGMNPIPPDGIRISNWEIQTRNSSIGDGNDMSILTTRLEGIANEDENDEGGVSGGGGNGNTRRRLCPPEITFLDAFVSCRYYVHDTDDDGRGEGGELRLDARSALMEWAEAHRYMRMPFTIRDIRRGRDVDDIGGGGECHRGVSVMHTVDAEIWSSRSIGDDECDVGGGGGSEWGGGGTKSGECEFYYDWTYSSPYAGTATLHRSTVDPHAVGGPESSTTTTTTKTVNDRQLWRRLRKSHIPLHTLRDNAQPILLYDDVHIYEDDLHDNGEVSLNVKIRVMPTCWYVLQRLYVRVDRMCVRCREVRYFTSFVDVRGDDESNEDATARANVIYRDVTWREATWGRLEDAGMPTDPAAWRERDGNNSVVGGNGANCIPAPPPLASLLMRLPSVALPDDIPKYSCFDVSHRS